MISSLPLADPSEIPPELAKIVDQFLQNAGAPDGVEWLLSEATAITEGAAAAGILVSVTWSVPIESSGPWRWAVCDGSIVTEASVRQRAIYGIIVGLMSDADEAIWLLPLDSSDEFQDGLQRASKKLTALDGEKVESGDDCPI